MDLNNLEDVERFKRLFLDPIQQSVRDELAPLTQQVRDHDVQIKSLQSNQKKAMLGYAGIVAAVTIAFNYFKAKFIAKL